jgi:hypothetical protein
MNLSIDPLFVISSPIVIYVLSTFIFPYYYKNEDPTIYLLLTFFVLIIISISILIHELPTLIYCKLKNNKCSIRFFPFFSLKRFDSPMNLKTRIVIDISSFFSLVVFTSILFLLLYINSILIVPWWIISVLDVSLKCLLILIFFHLLPSFPSDIWYILFCIFSKVFKQKIVSFNFLFKASSLFNSTLIIISISMLLYGYFLQGFLMIMFSLYLRYFTLKYVYNEIETFDLLFTNIDKRTLLWLNSSLESNNRPDIFSKSVLFFSIHYTNQSTNRVIEHTILQKNIHHSLLQRIDTDTKLKMLKTLSDELEIK